MPVARAAELPEKEGRTLADVTLPLIARARRYAERTAIVQPREDGTDIAFRYGDLLAASARVAAALLDGQRDLQEARVAYLVPAGFDYVAVQWGIWRAGGIAVPLCPSHPRPELEYVIDDSRADIVVAHPDYEDTLRPIAATRGLRFLSSSEGLAEGRRAGDCSLPALTPERRALMIYTSGTTSKPKGVVTTHGNIEAQVTSLVTAWEWTERDAVLHVLPLHHIHGIINVLTCALWSGARCHMLPRFDADEVWNRFVNDDLTLFMAVPTIYNRLIAAWEAADLERRALMSTACRKLRLMVSGSAALPVSTWERWREISGHALLERYGMTEIGMAISNPLRGERRPGYVGVPLPGVEVKLVDEEGRAVPPGNPGEICVRGPGVFREYWGRPDATHEAFRDGWFRTGDVAVVEDGYYRILGRASVDIIKTGGYKVSALEIEEVLRAHPAVEDCAVVGVADPDWGERVCAAVVLKRDGDREQAASDFDLEALRAWAKERLAAYKVPTRLAIVEALPRNAMGKVTKPAVAALFERSSSGA